MRNLGTFDENNTWQEARCAFLSSCSLKGFLRPRMEYEERFILKGENMIKKIIMMMTAAVAMVCVQAATTYTETVDGIEWTYTVTNGKASLGEGGEYSSPAVPESTSGAIIIPSTLGGYPVRSIGSRAFIWCKSLTSVTIPDSVWGIGPYAFYGCGSLTSVTIPNSVQSIQDSAFLSCWSLMSVTIPDSVMSIGRDAFYGCSSLTSVTIPDSVTSIGDYAFRGCSSLTSVTIPDSITSISSYAFDGCSSLTSITIPDSVTSIGDYAFCDCSSLTSVTIPNSVTSIGRDAFYGCSSLTSVTIPDSVTSIGDYAFEGCSGLADSNGFVIVKGVLYDYLGDGGDVVIPDGVTSIGDYAFYYCYSLTSVTIPNSVTSIGERAFSGCSSLKSVTIPNSVTRIGGEAFEGCSGLADSNGFVIVKGVLCDYLGDGGDVVIPDGVTSIGSYAFYGCRSLTSVTIPNSVTNIGNYAFEYCSSLTSVTIGDSVTSIGDYVFRRCSSLTNIIFQGNAPKSLGFGLFNFENHSECTAYVKKNSTGWGVDIPGKWKGINIAYLEEDDEEGDDFLSGVTNLVTSADGPAALQTAIEAANEGDVILVGPGTYSPIRTNGKKITIKSTDGAAKTIIDGGCTNRCATLADDTMGDWWLGDWAEDQYVEYTPPSPYNTTLIGFTLCNGNSYWKGRVEYYEDGSQENVLPSRAFEGGGAFGGVLVDCVVSNNVVEFIFEKGSIYYETNEETGEMVLEVQEEDDSEARGGGVSFAKLYNCLVTKNKATIGGSGIDNCYAYNCTIVGNYCETREEDDFDAVFDVENSEIYNTIMSVTPYWGGGYAMDVGDVKAENCAIVSETGGALLYNYFDECWNGDGDIYSYDFIVGDIKFVNPSIGDYRLQHGSVAIDAGNESYVQPLNSQYGDLDGNVRVRDTVDIGAYESVSIRYSYDQIANGEIVLTGIIGEVPENWVCPSMYEGNKVVGLGDHFLAESEEIRSVVLADTIREVGESAFKKCPNLSSVILNEGLEIIRGYAFRKCFSLESVILPSSISIIEERAFCRSGENYRWDEGDGIGIQRIEIRGGENDAFSCEDGVLYDKINKKVIMARANIERVVLPEDCTRIGDCAFLSCYNLNEVVWNTALSEIGDEAFAGTYLTTGDLSKTSLTLAQEQAFAGCSLKEVVFPSTLRTVGSHLFGLCDSLESVRFLGNAPEIDNSAEETEEGLPNGDIYVTISSGSVEDVYDIHLPNVTTFVEKGTSGWGEVPGTWQGCPINYWATNENDNFLSGVTNLVTSADGPAALQAAIEAANEGDVILVGPGTYSPIRTNGKKITIKSTDGAAKTIIDGGCTNRCATLADVALEEEEDGIVIEGSTLVGFTLMRGYNRCVEGVTEICTDGGAVFGGTVVNCIIKDSESYLIEDGFEDGCGGGACRAALYNCLIIGNTAALGAGASDCILYNCTVVANVNGACPIGYSKAYNCIITGGGILDTWNSTYNNCLAPSGEYPTTALMGGDLKFVDPSSGDYRLQQGSSAIDAGSSDNVQSFNLEYGDLGQNKRIKDIVDIGAYEYGASPLVVPVYEMSFASGGATEGDVPEVISFKADEEVELPGCGSLSWPKHTFVGWSDGISTYDSGAIYTGESNVVMTAQWVRNELAMPVISAPETFEADSCEVTIACDNGPTIHYTLDGTEPTAESPFYTGPIVITGTTEIKAIAIRDNYFDSSIASFTVTRGVWTFGEYLNWADQEFETGGNGEWTRDKKVSFDGYALKSGKILRNQKSCLTTTVQGAGTISFMLKVSSEADEETGEPYDGFVLAVDGVDVTELIGGEIDWRRVSFKIVGDGLHNIEWRYEKDKIVDAGEDCAWIDEVVWSPEDPIPELGASATASEVAAALDGSADANLAENIKTAAEYAAYRTWALKLGGVTPREVKDSPNAWLSFALDADELIAAVPKEGDIVIDAFESAATDGAFEFTVKIDGIEVGDNALEANIRKVFDIEGTKTLVSRGVGFSFDNVVVNVVTPENGNVKFTVTPKMENGEKLSSFFIRVKMK